MHIEVGQDALGIRQHVHQMRDRRALIATDITDAGLQQRLGDREDALAAAMAREALTRLANAEQDPGEGSDEPVTPAALVGAIESSAAPFVAGLRVASAARGDAAPIPGRVARAIVLAATQAVANSVQHAGGRGLSVELGTGSRRVIVRIVDTGDGFSPDEVDDDRLGIRGSIVARMAAAGGRARVHTSDAGTQVVLEWERPR